MQGIQWIGAAECLLCGECKDCCRCQWCIGQRCLSQTVPSSHPHSYFCVCCILRVFACRASYGHLLHPLHPIASLASPASPASIPSLHRASPASPASLASLHPLQPSNDLRRVHPHISCIPCILPPLHLLHPLQPSNDLHPLRATLVSLVDGLGLCLNRGSCAGPVFPTS